MAASRSDFPVCISHTRALGSIVNAKPLWLGAIEPGHYFVKFPCRFEARCGGSVCCPTGTGFLRRPATETFESELCVCE
jgi:hypothetical protein